MATTLDLETAERQARELLDTRITAVRELVIARQRLAELRDDVAAAEREDVRLYNAAVTGGWSPDELRRLGIVEPAKKARVRRRTTTRGTDAAPGDTATAGARQA